MIAFNMDRYPPTDDVSEPDAQDAAESLPMEIDEETGEAVAPPEVSPEEPTA